MKLTEIFSQLTYGELSQLSLGGGEAGEINTKNYPQVLAHINLGLTALYKRFPLKEGQLTLALQPGRISYPLTVDYAESNTASAQLLAQRFITDSVSETFIGDILKVEAVFADSGEEFALNDWLEPYSIMTPSATVLRVPPLIVARSSDLPSELQTSNLRVVYRANHPILSQDDPTFDVDTTEVELPYSHLEPLLFFVASRVNTPIGMVNEFNAGNNYAAKYEQACQQLEVMNLKVDQGGQVDRLRRNGWI